MKFEIKKINGELINPVQTGIVRLCSTKDHQNICDVQNTMTNHLENKKFCLPISDNRIMEILKNPNNGFFFGAFQEDKMIAWKYVSFNASYIKGLLSHIPAAKGRYAILDGTAVLPEYRGNNLQKILIGLSEEHAKKQGVNHLIAEITDGNMVSLKNLLNLGYTVKGGFEKSKDFKVQLLQKTILKEKEKFCRPIPLADNKLKKHYQIQRNTKVPTY